MYDIIIIGAGPAGLNAALYASRAGKKTLVLEKTFAGGQAATTYEVDNYIGVDKCDGATLSMKMLSHATLFGAEIKYEDVLDINIEEKRIKTTKNEYKAKAIILSMGANPRKIGLENEDKLRGRGVSYCATCDGNFFKDKTACVVGGGDTALEDAIYLSALCKKVYLIHRRNSFRAVSFLINKVAENSKIECIFDSTVEKINGDSHLESIVIKNVNTDEETLIDTNALFVAIGTLPNTDIVKNKINLDENGYILTDNNMKTNKDGIYAAGDIIKKPLRQIITAASDGAVAANSAVSDIS